MDLDALDDMHRAVILARRDIAAGRSPDPRWRQSADMCVFSDLIDPDAEDAKAQIVKAAEEFGLVDRDAGQFDAQMMDLTLTLAERMFWLGLTRGHVLMGGGVSIPYRLFPGMCRYDA